jgi:hypothetical protein
VLRCFARGCRCCVRLFLQAAQLCGIFLYFLPKLMLGPNDVPAIQIQIQIQDALRRELRERHADGHRRLQPTRCGCGVCPPLAGVGAGLAENEKLLGHERKLSADERQKAPRSLRVWRPPNNTRRAAIRARADRAEDEPTRCGCGVCPLAGVGAGLAGKKKLLGGGDSQSWPAEGSCGGAGSVPSLQICRWPFFSARG